MAIAEIVKGMVEELKNDTTARLDEVKEHVDDLEKNMADKCTVSEVKEHVSKAMQQKTSKIKQAIDYHLEDEIKYSGRKRTGIGGNKT